MKETDRTGGKGESEGPVRFEEVLSRVEEIVGRIESGDLDLEESLRLFEEGMSLIRRADKMLTEAEVRVAQLVASPQGIEEVPLDAKDLVDGEE